MPKLIPGLAAAVNVLTQISIINIQIRVIYLSGWRMLKKLKYHPAYVHTEANYHDSWIEDDEMYNGKSVRLEFISEFTLER